MKLYSFEIAGRRSVGVEKNGKIIDVGDKVGGDMLSLLRGGEPFMKKARDAAEKARAEVQRLQDPRYLEYLARERFGYMRPNEVFILLDTPQGNSAPSPQSSVDN